MAAFRQAETQRKLRKESIRREHKKQIKRESWAFFMMGRYLKKQSKAIADERYVTAMYGCRTSWPRIEAAGIYHTYARNKGERRSERPEHGGNWPFVKRTAYLTPRLMRGAAIS
jgi:hypothetical protein